MHDPATEHARDLELTRALDRGDPAAFDELYERHREWVLRLALRLTGRHEDALDVLQETFLYLLGKFPGFELRSRLRTFLHPVVRHLAIDVRRRSGRYSSDEEALLAATRQAAVEARPAGATREELGRVLANLPEPQREVMLLRFVDELTVDETAQVLDVPGGTVKSRTHQALAKLREDPATRRYFDA